MRCASFVFSYFLQSTTVHSGLKHVVCRPNPKTLNTRFGVVVLLKRGVVHVLRRSTTHHGRDVGTRAYDCLCLEQHGHRRTHFISFVRERPRQRNATAREEASLLCWSMVSVSCSCDGPRAHIEITRPIFFSNNLATWCEGVKCARKQVFLSSVWDQTQSQTRSVQFDT